VGRYWGEKQEKNKRNIPAPHAGNGNKDSYIYLFGKVTVVKLPRR
jgi:hypothetical protein